MIMDPNKLESLQNYDWIWKRPLKYVNDPENILCDYCGDLRPKDTTNYLRDPEDNRYFITICEVCADEYEKAVMSHD